VSESKKRKHLYNMLQEMRGNIRVYVRVRPATRTSDDDAKTSRLDAMRATGGISFPAANALQLYNAKKRAASHFEFERVFGAASTQDDVFAEVSPLVVSLLDGYNVCIFAYGQTGSGKTHTMLGTAEKPGVNLRALRLLFDTAEQRQPDVTHTFSVSVAELYNNDLLDLMSKENKKNKTPLKVHKGAHGSMEAIGITVVAVETCEQVEQVLQFALQSRTTASTLLNNESSRSHLLMNVTVVAHNHLSRTKSRATLFLCDLAGSERVSRSGVTGQQMKEAQAINSSLTALGNVLNAKLNKQKHVPYRDSQLTFYLKDALNANSKTCFIVQVNPNTEHASESLCSLKFGERVRKVELGKAKRNLIK
jgi:kinesin family protein C2/C3